MKLSFCFQVGQIFVAPWPLCQSNIKQCTKKSLENEIAAWSVVTTMAKG